MGPQIYLILALAAATPITYGVMWVKREAAVKAAFEEGKRLGKAVVAHATNEASRSRVESFETGWAEPAPVSPEKARIIELCAKSSSCRDRGR